MKLSFSTNGWQDLSWAEFINTANDLGFSGIEIHNITDERFTGADAPFSKANSSSTVHKLLENSISIPCIDTYCNIADEKTADEGFEEIATAIEIAARIRCSYVRIHAYSTGAEKSVEDAAVISLIGRLIESAIAANSIATTLFQVATVIAYASSNVACVLIGKTIGENKPMEIIKSRSKNLQLIFLAIGVVSSLVLLVSIIADVTDSIEMEKGDRLEATVYSFYFKNTLVWIRLKC